MPLRCREAHKIRSSLKESKKTGALARDPRNSQGPRLLAAPGQSRRTGFGEGEDDTFVAVGDDAGEEEDDVDDDDYNGGDDGDDDAADDDGAGGY